LVRTMTSATAQTEACHDQCHPLLCLDIKLAFQKGLKECFSVSLKVQARTLHAKVPGMREDAQVQAINT